MKKKTQSVTIEIDDELFNHMGSFLKQMRKKTIEHLKTLDIETEKEDYGKD